jgi:hypothetical protein
MRVKPGSMTLHLFQRCEKDAVAAVLIRTRDLGPDEKTF